MTYHDLGTENPENVVAEQPSQENGCRREAGDADKSDALRVGGGGAKRRKELLCYNSRQDETRYNSRRDEMCHTSSMLLQQ